MHFLCCRSIHFPVENNDAAEDGHRVRFIGIVPGCLDVICLADAARIHMLEGHHGWAVLEVTDDANGCIRITDIVEGQLLAVELLGCSDGILCWQSILVEVRILLRVFSVAHGLFEVVSQG